MRSMLRIAKWIFRPLTATTLVGCAEALALIVTGQHAALAAEPAAPAQKVAAGQPARLSNTAQESRDADRSELERILSDLHDVITNLATEGSMSAEQVYYYQRELASIYGDLDALSLRLDSADYGTRRDHGNYDDQGNHYGWGNDEPGLPPAADTWQSYDDASLDVSPRSAQWNGWGERSSIDLKYGDYGELRLIINSGYYTADWTIRDAYNGKVDTKVTTQEGGGVLLTVNDDDGQHQFKLDSGGLGDIAIRGREGYRPSTHAPGPPPKTVSPAPGTGDEQSGQWYDAYVELVDAGQLGQSRAMDGFSGQTDSGKYVNAVLRKLGERLEQPVSANMRDTIGVMSYFSGNERKKMAIPNPRMSPASFITLISKAYNMTQDGKSYSFALD
jgi:hypothetical protein